MGLVGVCIVHDVNHGAGLPSATGRYVLGSVVDLVRPLSIWPPFLPQVLNPAVTFRI